MGPTDTMDRDPTVKPSDQLIETLQQACAYAERHNVEEGTSVHSFVGSHRGGKGVAKPLSDADHIQAHAEQDEKATARDTSQGDLADVELHVSLSRPLLIRFNQAADLKTAVRTAVSKHHRCVSDVCFLGVGPRGQLTPGTLLLQCVCCVRHLRRSGQ